MKLFHHPVFIFLFLASLSLSCARSTPVDFKAGEYSCEFCQMSIVDLRFKAEILTHKGKIHRFDSIECMMGWWKNHPQETQSRWASDFYQPQKWILLEDAFILKSERLASPMGAYLSAYGSEEEVQRAQREFGGNVISLSELAKGLQQP